MCKFDKNIQKKQTFINTQILNFIMDKNHNYNINNSDFNDEDSNGKTLQNFFKIKQELEKRELRWKGLGYIDGKIARISDPIAPDHFISALINTIASVMGEHNVLTKLSSEEIKGILMEKYISLIQASLREPFFNWDLFPLVKEEFDHSLQLFITFAKEGWGTTATTSLQAGVVAEQTGIKDNESPYMNMAKKIIQRKGDIKNVLEEESENY
jgi:hypothetical protein